MGRILLVDSAQESRRAIADSLGKDNEIVAASSLKEALDQLARTDFDLVLTETRLSDGDGYQLCAMLKQKELVPLIFVANVTSVSDIVIGFSLGAEDFVTKPFDSQELKARVEARMRKHLQGKSRELIVQAGDIRVNVTQQKAWVLLATGELQLDLTPLEFKLLLHFARHEEHVFTRERLLEAIWTGSVNVLDRTVDMHVSNLRRKLGRSRWTLRSVHGVGYRLTRAPMNLGQERGVTDSAASQG